MPDTPLSACLITFNEADRIDDAIRSLSFCDEVVVVDSGSTDDTVARALALGVRVLHRPFDGYRAQKDFAVRACAHDWVLCLDADERVDAELAAAIAAERATGFARAPAYRIARLTDYFGAFLRHGEAYPDAVVRLFDRRRARWAGREVHEHVDVDGRIADLGGHLEHFSYRSHSEELAKLERYAERWATLVAAEGRRGSLVAIVVNPAWRFFRGYVLKTGFLDGWRGFVYAATRAAYVRQKYVKLWLKARGEAS
jgi:glycosyltransferase involved in cell wall biosynthesis